MIWFKACPRCGRGDMLLERDVDGEAKVCMQCSYREYLAPASVVGRSVPLEAPHPHFAPRLPRLSA